MSSMIRGFGFGSRSAVMAMLAGAWLFALARAAPAEDNQDNQLTAEEEAAGWQLLFNGRDHTGWKCNNGKPIASSIEDGALVPYQSGGYLIVYEKPFGDFRLKCDVRMAEPYCNSGIFFRVGDLNDPVQTGFECQIASASLVPYHAYGAIYDLAKPSEKALTDDPFGWHTVEIICRGPHIEVAVDGRTITTMNCDDFTEPGKRADGSQHKFRAAIIDMPRAGYLGFQDHGQKCWFKNVKLLELDE